MQSPSWQQRRYNKGDDADGRCTGDDGPSEPPTCRSLGDASSTGMWKQHNKRYTAIMPYGDTDSVIKVYYV